MPLPTNRAIIAAAGSRKTQFIIDAALAASKERVLVTTYTEGNLAQIICRMQQANGVVPPNITVSGWFSFLINQAARPYQSALTKQIDFMKSLNFVGDRPRFTPQAMTLRYYFDKSRSIYRDGVADFACRLDEATGGCVVRRLERLYDHIYIDELQDLAGYDLEFLDLLFKSSIRVTAVGDPRQHTYNTNNAPKNKQYRGQAVMGWLAKRSKICVLEPRTESWRCNQEICDWADALYPDMPATTSRNEERTGHDGIFRVARQDVVAYFEKYRPAVLRHNRVVDTLGLPAQNIGVSKGSTYDRALIFPTQPILKYLKTGDLSAVEKSRESLYVAVTRARNSAAFVVDRKDADYTP
jgi:DNA helicase-2/ATP-dependent DNA helicase PcrA